jgi:PHD-finger
MVMCDKCNKPFHETCLQAHNHPAPRPGPWLCKDCRAGVILTGVTDPTYDFGLCDYLFTGVLPESLEEVERIKREA